MSKAAIFTMKLEQELRDAFVAEAQATHRPASQVVRDLMRQFIAERQEQRDHAEFLQRKVDRARASVGEGRGRPNDAVEATFAAWRDRLAEEA